MFTSKRITTMGGDKFRNEYSLAFDGTDDYIDCGSGSSIDNIFDGGGTIAGWIKVASDGEGNFGRIADKASAGNGEGGWSLTVEDESSGAVDLNFMVGHSTTNGRWLTTSREITLNTWVHFAVVYDDDAVGNNAVMYINGISVVLTESQTPVGTKQDDAAQDLIIGAGTIANRSFEGSMSEIVMYDTALSASQVKTLYNGREPYNHKEGIATGNLKAWYRMGDGRFENKKATTGVGNSDIKTYLITDEVTPTLSSEKYTATNALANLNNAQAQTDIDQVYEGGSAITSGTSQTDNGLSAGRYAMHIQASSNEDRIAIDLDDYLTKGKVYVLSCVAKHSGSGDDAFLKITDSGNLDASGDSVLIETLGTSETGWAYYGFVFEHTSAAGDQGSTEFFGVREGGGSNNAEFWVSELSIKEVGGNAGVMTNMSINDFEGDTP